MQSAAMPRVLDPVNYPMDRFANYQLSEATVNSKGAKSCKLESNGAQIVFNLGEYYTRTFSPFGATSYNDDASVRQTIEFKLSDEQQKHWECFDAWAIAYLSAHSERLFKKPMSPEQIRESYRSPVTRKGDYPPHLRCKTNTAGPKVCRAWQEQTRIDLPSNLRNVPVIPRITLSHLWIMSTECGFVLSVNYILCLETPEETCPF
jgi:hypothetical protein